MTFVVGVFCFLSTGVPGRPTSYESCLAEVNAILAQYEPGSPLIRAFRATALDDGFFLSFFLLMILMIVAVDAPGALPFVLQYLVDARPANVVGLSGFWYSTIQKLH